MMPPKTSSSTEEDCWKPSSHRNQLRCKSNPDRCNLRRSAVFRRLRKQLTAIPLRALSSGPNWFQNLLMHKSSAGCFVFHHPAAVSLRPSADDATANHQLVVGTIVGQPSLAGICRKYKSRHPAIQPRRLQPRPVRRRGQRRPSLARRNTRLPCGTGIG